MPWAVSCDSRERSLSRRISPRQWSKNSHHSQRKCTCHRASAAAPRRIRIRSCRRKFSRCGRKSARSNGVGGRLRAQPDLAALHVHPQIVHRFGPQDGFQFQGVQQHLHAVGQVQGFASFEIHHAAARRRPCPSSVMAIRSGWLSLITTSSGIEAVALVEAPRQSQGRLVDERTAFGLPQQPQRLRPIEPSGVHFAFAGRDLHAPGQILLQDGLFPQIAAVQDGLTSGLWSNSGCGRPSAARVSGLAERNRRNRSQS